MGLQSQLLGAHADGIRNILAVTGDPPHVGDYPGSRGVYEVDAIGLTAVLARLNEGEDYVGKAIDAPTSFYVGVAVNPSAEGLDHELERFRRKVENGARFAMTQALFDAAYLDRFLDALGGESPIPLLVGVWPVRSYELAFRLHNEVPGIVIPDDVQKRLADAGPDAAKVGLEVARELVEASRRARRASTSSRRSRSPRRRSSPAVSAERRSWAEGEELAAYHDEEWGRPVTDERGIFERLSLEAFQSGLSWVTILRKREGFRRAFSGFDPEAVARFGPADVERLLADAGIVRNRAKIEAAIANARATVALREGEGLASLAWSFAPEPGRAAPGTLGESPGGHARVGGACQGAQGPRLPVRRPHDRVRAHAGVRGRQRPCRRLLRAGRGRAGARASAGGGSPGVKRHGSAPMPAQSASHAAQIPR